MSRSTRRIASAAAAVALAVSAPGVVGIAQADDNGSDSDRRWGLSSEVQQNQTLVAAITTARDDYRTAVRSAKDAYRATMGGIWTTIQGQTQTQRDAVTTAKKAYLDARAAGADTTAAKMALSEAIVAYRSALQTAKAGQQTAITNARSTARTTLTQARDAYRSAITAAFAAAGLPVPDGLLTMGGRNGFGSDSWLSNGFGHMKDHGRRS